MQKSGSPGSDEVSTASSWLTLRSLPWVINQPHQEDKLLHQMAALNATCSTCMYPDESRPDRDEPGLRVLNPYLCTRTHYSSTHTRACTLSGPASVCTCTASLSGESPLIELAARLRARFTGFSIQNGRPRAEQVLRQSEERG